MPAPRKSVKKRPAPRLSDVPKERLISVGGPVDRVDVSLRFFGDELDPQEISTLLGCSPTSARRKGEEIPDKRYFKVASTGSWVHALRQGAGSTLENQIRRLLAAATKDIDVWVKLTTKYSADIFCGLFLNEVNRTTELSSQLSGELAARNITLRFDIYGYSKK
jgi:hypothetical protein